MWYRTPRFSQHEFQHTKQMFEWCESNLIDGSWGYASGVDTIMFTFEKQEDYTFFMMVWYERFQTQCNG